MVNLIGALIATLAIGTLSNAAELDTISREIRWEQGAVRVEDRLSCRAQFCVRDPVLDQIAVEVRQGKTNTSEWFKLLSEGESLEVERFTAGVRNEYVDLHIISKVVFKQHSMPAKVRWVPSFGGVNMKFSTGSLGRTGKGLEISIYENDGKPVLWFPYLGTASENSLTAIKEQKQAWEFMFADFPVQFTCSLKAGSRSSELFRWNQSVTVTNAPDGAAIGQMAKEKGMSKNDFWSLFTNFKTAKSGFYPMLPE